MSALHEPSARVVADGDDFIIAVVIIGIVIIGMLTRCCWGFVFAFARASRCVARCARVLARWACVVSCASIASVPQLNASDDRGIDVVRDQIKEFASTRSVFSSAFKLIVLDEADALTKVAQAALRRIIEMYSKSTRFCLICNYVSNIIPALQSRCMRLRFAPLEVDQIEARLNVVLERENVTLTPDGRVALLRLSRGDMRRCLNILQSASMASAVVDGEAVYTCTGHPMPSDITLILTWLLNESFATAFANVESLKVEKGLALVDVVSELHGVGVLRIKLSSAIKCFLYKELADLEHRMATSTSERIQLGSLVGMFQVAKRMIKDEMQAALAGADALAEGAHVRQ